MQPRALNLSGIRFHEDYGPDDATANFRPLVRPALQLVLGHRRRPATLAGPYRGSLRSGAG